jgi:hypothetical protein
LVEGVCIFGAKGFCWVWANNDAEKRKVATEAATFN